MSESTLKTPLEPGDLRLTERHNNQKTIGKSRKKRAWGRPRSKEKETAIVPVQQKTRSGRTVKLPIRYQQ